MITYTKHILSNGLTVIAHEDHATPLATVNVLYNVGARDENPNLTGIAHLFEHLMFGGTQAVPDYDVIVNGMGGESNAYTNNDYTNYYLTVPAQYVEKALWLEADRMRGLDFSQKALEVQQSVVTEEYHQRYENQPYGDVWMLLRPLCYKKHPYRWNTIGRTIQHVAEATLEDVKNFFYKYYRPNNAILCVAGNVKADDVMAWAEKYFGDIPSTGEVLNMTVAKAFARSYPHEDIQMSPRRLTVERDVPSSALYMAFPMCDRQCGDFIAADLLSDVLANGNSSRLYNELVKQCRLFTEIDACISGDAGPGLFLVSGKLREGVDIHQAEDAVADELRKLVEHVIPEAELQKVANKFESTFEFSQYKAADRATALCYFEWLGHIEWVNNEPEEYRKVTSTDLQRVAAEEFRPERCSTLEYMKQND
jgi:predicted Zn-dependent peptidase